MLATKKDSPPAANADDFTYATRSASVKGTDVAAVAVAQSTLITPLHSNVEGDSPELLKLQENLFGFVTFVLLGTAAMSVWNSLMNSLTAIQLFIFPGYAHLGDTLTAVYTTTALIGTAGMLQVNSLRRSQLLYSAAGFVLCCAVIAILIQYATGTTGVVLLHLSVAVGGCCTAIFESAMYGFASVMPKNYCGAASLGLGLSGLFTFLLWILFSQVFFEPTLAGVKTAILLFEIAVACLYIGGAIMFAFFLKRPWVCRTLAAVLRSKLNQMPLAVSLSSVAPRPIKDNLNGGNDSGHPNKNSSGNKEISQPSKSHYQEAAETSELEGGLPPSADLHSRVANVKAKENNRENNYLAANLASPEMPSVGGGKASPSAISPAESSLVHVPEEDERERTKWEVFKAGSAQIFNVSFTLWLTLMMFPNIAPLGWKRSWSEMDFLVGIFQFGDFSGRYLPNLRKWIPWVATPPKIVMVVTLARLLFLVPIVLAFKSPDMAVVSNFWFQAVVIFLFAHSSGWVCSLSSMYVPETMRNSKEKGQAATMYLLCLMSGLTVGVWMTKLWRL